MASVTQAKSDPHFYYFFFVGSAHDNFGDLRSYSDKPTVAVIRELEGRFEYYSHPEDVMPEPLRQAIDKRLGEMEASYEENQRKYNAS